MLIRNNLIPFKGYKAITLYPFIFIRKEYEFNEVDLNHEKIHVKQQLELLIIPFFIIYILEYMVRLLIHGDAHTAYRSISFEQEAYANQKNLDYLKTRRLFNQWRKN